MKTFDINSPILDQKEEEEEEEKTQERKKPF